ncbi:MAG TPA: bacteriohemerythrin [Rhodospirillaceae bacterium]|nr:bacteriohemerythrin [Rhodospirillaceae bacterium]
MSHRIEWSDDLLVKIDAIDRDHKHLFALANKIFANTGKDMALVSSAIDILFSYTKEHFSREETAMRDFNYPAIQDHIFDHKELVAQLNDFNDQFIKSGPKAIDESFATFLEHWLRRRASTILRQCSDQFRQLISRRYQAG